MSGDIEAYLRAAVAEEMAAKFNDEMMCNGRTDEAEKQERPQKNPVIPA